MGACLDTHTGRCPGTMRRSGDAHVGCVWSQMDNNVQSAFATPPASFLFSSCETQVKHHTYSEGPSAECQLAFCWAFCWARASIICRIAGRSCACNRTAVNASLSRVFSLLVFSLHVSWSPCLRLYLPPSSPFSPLSCTSSLITIVLSEQLCCTTIGSRFST